MREAFFFELQQPPLATVDHCTRPAPLAIGIELGAIDIAEIDDDAACEIRRNILTHLSREDEDRIDRPYPKDMGDP